MVLIVTRRSDTMKINQNTLAKQIAENEGLKEALTIAQIKEVIRLTLRQLADEWAEENEEGVITLIKSHM